MVLLALLARFQRQHGWRLAVAHFNHQLRGRSSDADERLVVTTATALGLPCHVGRGDVRACAREKKLSLEHAARLLRHRFLAQTAWRAKIATVALAHHADDQVELFFVRLLRGAGGAGLAGMKWRGPSPAKAQVALVRPLLDVPRAQLAAFARQSGIAFREDASNRSRDMLRNRIRHQLLPRLRAEFQPAIAAVVTRAMAICGAEAQLAADAAARWRAHRRRPAFDRLPEAVQRVCLKAELLRRDLPARFEFVEALRLRPGVVIQVAPKLAVRRDRAGRVVLVRARRLAPAGQHELTVALAGRAGQGTFAGLHFEWRILAGGRLPVQGVGVEYFDAEKVGSRLVLRHWRAGDRFQPIGMSASVKLQDLFVNAKVPRARRGELGVATTAAGEIFWVEGLRLGEGCKITGTTRRRLRWQWRSQPAAGPASADGVEFAVKS
jgi:tRNA(Ile)-lysidine synthase